MIKHIVMFHFLDEAGGRSKKENMQITADMLNGLQGVVPTLRSSRISMNAADANPENYDLVLEAEFDDMEGLNAYLIHPAHKAVGAFMRPVRKSRACVDFYLEEE